MPMSEQFRSDGGHKVEEGIVPFSQAWQTAVRDAVMKEAAFDNRHRGEASVAAPLIVDEELNTLMSREQFLMMDLPELERQQRLTKISKTFSGGYSGLSLPSFSREQADLDNERWRLSGELARRIVNYLETVQDVSLYRYKEGKLNAIFNTVQTLTLREEGGKEAIDLVMKAESARSTEEKTILARALIEGLKKHAPALMVGLGVANENPATIPINHPLRRLLEGATGEDSHKILGEVTAGYGARWQQGREAIEASKRAKATEV